MGKKSKLPWSTMKGRDDEKGMTVKINMIKKRLNFGKFKQGMFAEISDFWVLFFVCVCICFVQKLLHKTRITGRI